MSRNRQRKKQRAVSAQSPSKLVFTFTSVRMLKDALLLVDEAFARTTTLLPNLAFGHETLGRLKQKLDDMLQGEDWAKETPFDYNELHILYAAIHMYLVNLTLNGNGQLISTCLHLCKQFSAVIAALPPKELKASGQ